MSNFVFRDKKLSLNKELCNSLKDVYGIGLKKAKYITARLGFAYPFLANKLSTYYKGLLSGLLNNILIGDIKAKRIRSVNIRILKEVNSLKGKKHAYGLPIRGQRVKSNAQTQKRLFGRLKTNVLKSMTPKSDKYWRKKSQFKKRAKPYKRKK